MKETLRSSVEREFKELRDKIDDKKYYIVRQFSYDVLAGGDHLGWEVFDEKVGAVVGEIHFGGFTPDGTWVEAATDKNLYGGMTKVYEDPIIFPSRRYSLNKRPGITIRLIGSQLKLDLTQIKEMTLAMVDAKLHYTLLGTETAYWTERSQWGEEENKYAKGMNSATGHVGAGLLLGIPESVLNATPLRESVLNPGIGDNLSEGYRNPFDQPGLHLPHDPRKAAPSSPPSSRPNGSLLQMPSLPSDSKSSISNASFRGMGTPLAPLVNAASTDGWGSPSGSTFPILWPLQGRKGADENWPLSEGGLSEHAFASLGGGGSADQESVRHD